MANVRAEKCYSARTQHGSSVQCGILHLGVVWFAATVSPLNKFVNTVHAKLDRKSYQCITDDMYRDCLSLGYVGTYSNLRGTNQVRPTRRITGAFLAFT